MAWCDGYRRYCYLGSDADVMYNYIKKTMNSILRNILITVNSLALAGSILWIISKPDYEPIISTLVLIATLIGLWVTETQEKKALKQKH